MMNKLTQARSRVADLERQIEAERATELAALPAQFGFATTSAFLRSVRTAARAKSGGASKARRRSRAVITDATREQVKNLTEAGKTAAEIAKAAKISVPSVQNIKKALGLTKPRKR